MSLTIDCLTLQRNQRTVLRDVSLQLDPGEILGVLGPNGAGKSTLLAALAGELVCQTGKIMLNAKSLDLLPALEQAQRRVVVTQQSNLSFDLRVDEVVRMGAYPFSDVSREHDDQWFHRALVMTELLTLEKKVYTELSGGEQQRVQLARALVQCFAITHHHHSAYLLLDEPLANLDPRHQDQFMLILEELVHTEQIGVMIVVHDLNLAARHCDRLMLLKEGEVIAQGLPEDVLTSDALKRAFDMDWTIMQHPQDANRLLVLT
jgi:iron complex transport system ATP-binding protein